MIGYPMMLFCPLGITWCVLKENSALFPYNKFFIDQAWIINVLKTHKIYFGQYPSILTSNLVNNPYITTHNSSRQVKRLFHSLNPGQIAVRAQSKTLEKIQRNIAGKHVQLKTSEARMVKWIKEYNRSSWEDVHRLGISLLLWCALLENEADLYKCSCGGDNSLLSC